MINITSNRVRNIRENVGMSRKMFGEKLGVSDRSIEKYELGTRAISKTLQILINLLFIETLNVPYNKGEIR